MANSQIIVGYFGGTGRNKVLAQTLASTTETELLVGNDANASVIAVLTMPTQTQILGGQTPNDQSVNPALLNTSFSRLGYFGDANPPYNSGMFDSCKPFLVRVAGTYTPLTGTSSVSVLFKLYLGATKGGTNLAATTAILNTNAAGANYGFILEAQLKWDSLSQAVRGQYWWDGDGTTPNYNTWKTLTTAGSAVVAVSNLQFCVSTTWGAANGGTVNCSEFSIHQM